MAITLSTASRNAGCDAACALLNVSGPGNLQIATTGFATIVSTITLANPAFGAASNGVATLLGTPLQDTAADNSGTAAVWRMRTSGGTAIFSGAVKTADDGSDLTIDVTAQNATINAITALVNAGTTDATGDLQITTSGDTGFTTPLITIALQSTAFGAASAGTAAINGTPSGNATVAGTAALFRVRNRDNTEVWRGSVGTSGQDMNFNNTTFGVGSTITITSYAFTLPATSAASSGVIVFAGGLAFTQNETVELSSYTYNQPA